MHDLLRIALLNTNKRGCRVSSFSPFFHHVSMSWPGFLSGEIIQVEKNQRGFRERKRYFFYLLSRENLMALNFDLSRRVEKVVTRREKFSASLNGSFVEWEYDRDAISLQYCYITTILHIQIVSIIENISFLNSPLFCVNILRKIRKNVLVAIFWLTLCIWAQCAWSESVKWTEH